MSDERPQTKGSSEKGAVSGVRGFFTSLPGILTGVAALITATVGLLAFLNDDDPSNGVSNGPAGSWVTEVNRVCLTAADRIDAIQLGITPDGAPDFSSFDADHSEAMERLVDDFKELSPPSGLEAQASELIRLWEQSSDSFFRASLANSEPQRNAAADEAYRFIIRAGDIASELGAVACADLPKD